MKGKRNRRTPPEPAGFDPSIFDDPLESAPEPTATPAPVISLSRPAAPPSTDALSRLTPPPADCLQQDRILYIPSSVMMGMAAVGCSNADIYHCFGMTERAWVAGLGAHPEIREALDQHRAEGVRSIIKALFNEAKAGDLRAIEFWLVNRVPEEWAARAKVAVEHSGKVETGKAELLKDLPDDEVAARLEAAAAELRKRSDPDLNQLQ